MINTLPKRRRSRNVKRFTPVQPLASVGRDTSHVVGRRSAKVDRRHIRDRLPLRFQLHRGYDRARRFVERSSAASNRRKLRRLQIRGLM